MTSPGAHSHRDVRRESTAQLGFRPCAEPTKEDIDALVGPATPHFAPQLRARVEELVLQLAEGHPVKRYAREKIELLERLAFASSKAEEGPREPRSRPGWEELPSTAPARRTAARSEMSPGNGALRRRDGRDPGDREDNRAAARVRRRCARRPRVHAERRSRRGGRRGSPTGRRRACAGAGQRRVGKGDRRACVAWARTRSSSTTRRPA